MANALCGGAGSTLTGNALKAVKAAIFMGDPHNRLISDRGTIPYFGIEDGTTSLVSLYIIGCAKGILQHLKHVLWLSHLESVTELVALGSQHHTAHRGPITGHFW